MRAAFISLTLLVWAGAGIAGDNKPPKPPKPPKAPPAPKVQNQPVKRPNAVLNGAVTAPRRPIDDQIEKLAKMSPAERERALSGVPEERRVKLEAGLDRWNKMSPELKAAQAKFRSLPQETQQRIRQLSLKLRALPEDRKIAVRRELLRLRNMPDAQREKRLNSSAVQKNFSPDEQDILREPSLLPQNYF